jgi:hypothetical protein
MDEASPAGTRGEYLPSRPTNTTSASAWTPVPSRSTKRRTPSSARPICARRNRGPEMGAPRAVRPERLAGPCLCLGRALCPRTVKLVGGALTSIRLGSSTPVPPTGIAPGGLTVPRAASPGAHPPPPTPSRSTTFYAIKVCVVIRGAFRFRLFRRGRLGGLGGRGDCSRHAPEKGGSSLHSTKAFVQKALRSPLDVEAFRADGSR